MNVPKSIGTTQPFRPTYREFSESDVPLIYDLIVEKIDNDVPPELDSDINLDFVGYIHTGLWGSIACRIYEEMENVKCLRYKKNPHELFIKQFSR